MPGPKSFSGLSHRSVFGFGSATEEGRDAILNGDHLDPEPSDPLHPCPVVAALEQPGGETVAAQAAAA